MPWDGYLCPDGALGVRVVRVFGVLVVGLVMPDCAAGRCTELPVIRAQEIFPL